MYVLHGLTIAVIVNLLLYQLTFLCLVFYQVEWDGDAGGIEVNGSTYKLVQCHWHTPSEHTIDGKRYVCFS